MTDPHDAGAPGAPGASAPPGAGHERRVRSGLRVLIDEMMMQLRTAAQHDDAWTPEERARAEADLARIMGQVRDETFRTPDGDA